ncbi:hypothetical protein PMAYCL1PPCAC_00987, partial [Pristionchus mayeri]
ETELLEIPPMCSFSIMNGTKMSSELVVKLAEKHKHTYVWNATIASNDLMKVVQIISSDADHRSVKMFVSNSNLEMCLLELGIQSIFEEGLAFESYGKFALINRAPDTVNLRYRRCVIK